jgi:cytochrome P450
MSVTLAAPRKQSRNLPPGPRGWLVFGNVPFPGADWLIGFERAARQFGDVVYFQFLHVPMIMLVHPDAIESVLLTEPANFLKSRDYRALAKVLGNGLLTSEGEEWRAQRKMLQPAFRRENILAYAPVMSDCAARMMDSWRDGETRDLHQEMMALTVEIVAKALFGADISASTERVGSALETAMKQFTRIAGWAFLLPDNFPVPGTRRMRRARLQLDEIIYGIIRERRASSRNSAAENFQAGSAGNSRDLLGALLEIRDEHGHSLTDVQLRDQLMTLFLAGHETTAIALSWTWYLLATNPDAESKLHAELDQVLRGRAPTAEDLPRMPYTEMVLKESMRLYPPAWGIGRQARSEFHVGGYTLPARTNIFMLQWVTQRDARFFPEPERFLPERWREDPVRTGKIPRFAYFPFGGGPRVCIGAGFAMMEAALLLASIAQRFRFELVPDHPIKLFPSVTLRPKYGIHAVLHRR